MELNNWDSDKYNEFTLYLYSLQDLDYKKFHSKIVSNDVNLIGIRTPILKNMAKEISKGDYKNFIKLNKHETYEEIILHGLVLGYIKGDFSDIVVLLEEFIQYIDNWAINDITVANLKIFSKNLDSGFDVINNYISSDNEWSIRFGLILLLDFYINDTYINDILNICNNIECKKYYVMMANAWLISVCYVKYPSITHEFLKNNKLDKITHNKAISKIIESRRVDIDTKNILRTMKRE